VIDNVLSSVVAPTTSKFHPTVASQEVCNVTVVTALVSTVVAVTSPAVKVVMLPVVALTVSAVIVCQVNVPSAEILPVKVTSPLIVSNVTLDKSKFIPSITFSNAVGSREIL
jgi:hypothetical protein